MMGQGFQDDFKEVMPEPPVSTPFKMVIGVISDLDEQVIPLLQDVLTLKEEEFLTQLDVFILDNNPDKNDTSVIGQLLDQISNTSKVISRMQQMIDRDHGLFGPSFVIDRSRLPISKARTILQKYLGLYAVNNPGAIVWILDDDMRLHDKVFRYLPWLPTLRSTGIDILIGRYEGGSPNPPMNAVRVQTLDLLCNLDRLEDHDDNEVLPDLEHENYLLRKKYPDYYYDLSRKHTGHLETPYWVNKIDECETVAELRYRILRNIYKIITGEPFFRPLIMELPADPINDAVESVNRGGITWIFNPETLLRTPNPSIMISGHISRRSDMVWALINAHHYGYISNILSFPTLHNRTYNNRIEIDLGKTIQEIQGASLYAGLTEYFSRNPSSDFNFNKCQIDAIWRLTSEYLEKRISLYNQNFSIILELCDKLRKYDRYREVHEYVTLLNETFSKENTQRLVNEARQLTYEEIERELKSVYNQINDYSMSTSETGLFTMGDD